MTTRIDQPALLSARAVRWTCLILSGVGIVTVAERLPDLFEATDAQSCDTCLPMLHACTQDLNQALSQALSMAGSCAPIATMHEPLGLADSMTAEADPMLGAWRVSLIHSTALQTDPYTWEALPVRF